jgi:threonine dehydratase
MKTGQPGTKVTSGEKQLSVTFADIEAAAGRLDGIAVHTPIVESRDLNERVGGRVLLKLENLQVTGSFKFRGAYNRLSMLSSAERERGIVAFSTGNHAQAVACAAGWLDIPAIIAMPSDTPEIKVTKTRDYGANIEFFDRAREDGTDVGKKIAKDQNRVFVPPFNDERVIAGQGTCGLELFRQARAMGVETLDAAYVSSAGGGFISGCALALHTLSPSTEVYAVEAEGWDAIGRSLRSGRLEDNANGPDTICDAILATKPGDIPYQIFRHLLSGGLTINDQQAATAVSYAFNTLKQVVEPGGAAALASILARQHDLHGKTVGVVLCSGNIELSRLQKIVTG